MFPRICFLVLWPLWLMMLIPRLAAAEPVAVEVEVLDTAQGDPTAGVITSGSLDEHFRAFDYSRDKPASRAFWLRLKVIELGTGGIPTLNARKGRHLGLQVYPMRAAASLPRATSLPGFRGVHDVVFILPESAQPGDVLYARVEADGRGTEHLTFATSTLAATLKAGADHARMITLTFGALTAMALSALLIWFVLTERLLILYASLFSLQALYMAYLSGEGFEWPILSAALPLYSYAWNVPAALTGAIACLFVREIAELKRFSPRVYRAFGWLAIAFVVLTFANLAQHVGFGPLVAMIGNVMFVGVAVFTLVVAYLAWRRHNRAAGWFLLAWGLLETFTIITAVRLLVTDAEDSAGMLYYGLPLSMVLAAVLIALGVADRLRDQRLALTDAERRAQTDALTGVLNRRSLTERLEAACLRAQARGLPLALLFIDLDHFKQINDTYGHAAGDACLKAIIGPIQTELRHSDVIGRYGGEEFVVILSSADVAAAEPIAERIRKRVADVRVQGFGPPIHVTCSIGVATSEKLGVWGEQLIARADAAVYEAKRSGRNRVQIAEPLAA